MNVASLCSELVKIKTENPPGNTRECAEFIGEYLNSLGIDVEYMIGPHGQTNVYSAAMNNPLLLCGHIDVVPACDERWEYPPNSGKIDDTWVHGRGSSDMKGGCAAILSAATAYSQSNELKNVSFAFVCDEEISGPHGMRKLLHDKKIPPCDCLIAEPTPYQAPCIGQKGKYDATVIFHGIPGHASLYPLAGTSAIMQASSFLMKLPSFYKKEWSNQSKEMDELIHHSVEIASQVENIDCSQLFNRISYNPGIITGGEKSNIVAEKCRIDLDFRLPWNVTPDMIESELKTLLPVNAELHRISASAASLTSPSSKIVKTTCESISKIYGIESKPIIQWAASDARVMRPEGFNVVEYGPGLLPTIHSINEKVSIQQLTSATEIYTEIIRRYQ